MTNQLVSAAVLPRMFEIALHGHLDIQALFDGAGIDADAVGRPDHYVTMEQVDRLLSHAYQQVDDPLFGLRVGSTHGYTVLDLTGRLMASSATLERAFVMLLRYKDLFAPHIVFDLQPNGPNCILIMRPDPSLRFTALRLHGDLIVASALSILGSLLGRSLPLERAFFPFPPPQHYPLSEYQSVFQCELEFDADYCGLEFDRIWLTMPLPGAYPEYRLRLEQKAAQALRSLSRATSLSSRVLARLVAQLGQEPLNAESIAAGLNLSVRTMQRRLREENTSFVELRDQVRMEYACRRLEEGHCDKSTLAAYLGFSDTANFYHAFKRWKGCSPETYRQRLGVGGAADL